MDPHINRQPGLFSMYGPAFHEQSHNAPAASRNAQHYQVLPHSTPGFPWGPQYRNNVIPTSSNTSMEGVMVTRTSAGEQPQHEQTPATPSIGQSRRGKYKNLDWEGHKAHLQNLYLVQNNSLDATIDIMKKDHAFEATPRVYKDKFKQWGWQKNLPAKHAQFMVHKAGDRKRKERKDTVFDYGGQKWDSKRARSTLNRAKKAGDDDDVIDMNTPDSVQYGTPRSELESPESGDTIEDSESDLVVVDFCESEGLGRPQTGSQSQSQGGQELLLSWQGHSRTDLDNMWQRGQKLHKQGRLYEAEDFITRAREGMRRVLGETHEDSKKAAYYMANLYAEQKRGHEADSLVEELTRKHVEILGYEHKATQQHILHCVELLNTWGRNIDALAFLERAKEILCQKRNQQDLEKFDDKGKSALRTEAGSAVTSDNLALPAIADNDPFQIDHAIDLARSYVRAENDAVENFLLQIIQQCQRYHPDFHLQHLRARSELLKLYVATSRATDNAQAFETAKVVCQRALDAERDVWESDVFASVEVMEAALQLATYILKGGYDHLAEPLFERASEIATDTLGSDDERTIWIFISIGLVYQNHRGWDDAEQWFNNALCGAQSAFHDRDGIVMSLERATERKHFSYITDEGRPFKTVFGISGVVIRPGRLHLE